MRLKYVYISEYKNLKNFSLNFDSNSFIDIFVGKNGSGKSNFLEALILIFQHLYEQNTSIFHYKLTYEIDSNEIKIEWKNEKFFIDDKAKGQKTLGKISLPENILIYYSGHNQTVKELITKYEDDFRKKIKGANVSDSRKFIGIGSEYKNLLLTLLLSQPEDNQSRKHVIEKLGIKEIKKEVKITDINIEQSCFTKIFDQKKEEYHKILKKQYRQSFVLSLKRPIYADGRFKALGIKNIDNFDSKSHYWGADGITRTFLEKLKTCIKEDFNHTNIYNTSEDKYNIKVNIDLFREKFCDQTIREIFQSFDNLKTLGMLDSIDINLLLLNGLETNLSHFSDGQLQALYIYAITEIFKEKNCITLLDEPDSFLHPEWQFQFLQQIFEISEKTPKNNHILMCSHSASTITKADENTINMFEFQNNKVVLNKVKKSDIINSLSSGLIVFNEDEANFNITHFLETTSLPILFVEGITDKIILETAWEKLYKPQICPFKIQETFGCGFLRNFFSSEYLQKNYSERILFSLFDFDEAYGEWKSFKEDKEKKGWNLIEENPYKGLVKKYSDSNHYAMLLPVPNIEKIKLQVLDSDENPWKKPSDCYLSIELMFYKSEKSDSFIESPRSGGGKIIEFIGGKVKFAKNIVPTFPKEDFQNFIPIFDFIKSKCK